MSTIISIIKGDITRQKTEAIVNAANSSLLGGGGVDGAIHRAAGPELVFECRMLGGCKPGEAKLTKGYRLPAKYIVHTVGPVWNGGQKGEEAVLRNCYTNSLLVAMNNGIRTISFPNISTGIYHFPKERAASIAWKAAQDFTAAHPAAFDAIIFVCFDEENYNMYQALKLQC